MKETYRILTIDPSTKTGVAAVQLTWDIETRSFSSPELFHVGYFDFQDIKKKFERKITATEEKLLFQTSYSDYILKTLDHVFNDNRVGFHGVVISEFPHGSQSAKASQYMFMCTAIITSATIKELHKEPMYYMQDAVKKTAFGTGVVTKDQTINLMVGLWKTFGVDLNARMFESGFKTKASVEAVCDALLVLNMYLNKEQRGKTIWSPTLTRNIMGFRHAHP